MIPTTARNASLQDLHSMLQLQHDNKNDKVVPAEHLLFHTHDDCEGTLSVVGMGPDGPAGADGVFTFTDVFEEHVADKFKIPLPYLRRMRIEAPWLYDTNINGWIQSEELGNPEDKRNFFIRAFSDPEGGPGIARALLSDTYRSIDNLDVLMSALDGVKASGVNAEIDKCQLSERRMSVDIVCPDVAVKAAEMLRGYRDPFAEGEVTRAGGWSLEGARNAASRENSGYEPGSEPMLWAGFQINNSETGGGAFTLTPRVVFSICRNGLKLTRDMMRRVHLGARLEDNVEWSEKTKAANVELITSMATDAITTWLNPGYLETVQADLLAADGALSTPAPDALERIASQLHYTKEQQAGILEHFIRGGQITKLGVVNAITSFAQTVDSPDECYDLENNALEALALL